MRVRGSMGLPPEAKKAIHEYQEKRDKDEAPTPPNAQPDNGFEINEDVEEETAGDNIDPLKATETSDFQEMLNKASPKAMMEALGIDFNDDDFHGYVFKGFVEKTIVVVPHPKDPAKNFTVTFRTLTGEDHDLIDEILSEEARDVKMTNDGFNTRRSSLFLAASVQKLTGRDVVALSSVPKKDGELDKKWLITAKRGVLKQLADHVIDRMIKSHQTLSLAFRLVISDPEANPLKKS